MKKIIAIVIILGLTACSDHTDFGRCISPFADGKPELEYEIDTWNTVWSVIGFEMIFPPVLWAVKYGRCPIGKK